jgi:hypothetical protein
MTLTVIFCVFLNLLAMYTFRRYLLEEQRHNKHLTTSDVHILTIMWPIVFISILLLPYSSTTKSG